MTTRKIKEDTKDNRGKSGDRGYNFEHIIVSRFNTNEYWKLLRLGGTTVKLPDLVGTNNKLDILVTAELKSSTKDNIYIPQKQIERCFSIGKIFDKYNKFLVIFAFKFSKKKVLPPNKSRKKSITSRELKEFFIVFNSHQIKSPVSKISMNYYGGHNIDYSNSTRNASKEFNEDNFSSSDNFKMFDNFDKMVSYIESTKAVKRSKVT